MDKVLEFFGRSFLENTYSAYAMCVGTILLVLIFKKHLSVFLISVFHRAIKNQTKGIATEKLLALEQKPLEYLILLIGIYVGANQLKYPETWNLTHPDFFGIRMLIEMVFAIIVIITVTRIIIKLVDFIALIFEHRASKTDSKVDDQLVSFTKDILKAFIFIMSVFFTLAAVFKLNIATLIGGLGIGGLAVALAAKETLENLMGSVTIFLDRPFVIGDKVQIGDVSGHVEHIGLRSTRIRTFEKSLVTVPNKMMVDAELENTTDKNYWRIKFSVGVLYSTSARDIRNIMDQSLEYLNSHPLVEDNPIVKLEAFNSSSIDILYYILIKTSQWGTYLDVKEEIHFKVMEIVQNNNTDFAFPSRTVYLENAGEDENKG
jgi:MscS family membrane protein